MTVSAREAGNALVTPDLAAAAEAIDWSDLDCAAEAAESLLGVIAERLLSQPGVESQVPAGAVTRCAVAEGGLALLSCGQVEIAICRLRPAEGAVVQPHHVHQRPVAARVLRGNLRLALFGSTGPRLAEGSSSGDPAAPRFLREDGPGRTVTLHAEQSHVVEVDRVTTLLVLRGPVAAPGPVDRR